ncbi:hypothetical protein CYMTET_46992 [Cymbomonas tetramitiformis]|uniref:EGF-like domain-containing protein n=1 Tax=Cymbomonas tetramitiformis TaxID=36881 RepID=A0AAE0BWW1_9CHLO|nr:hypothetical protein CYMTET_46992 [Cymbomonas tetramitiformis]
MYFLAQWERLSGKQRKVVLPTLFFVLVVLLLGALVSELPKQRHFEWMSTAFTKDHSMPTAPVVPSAPANFVPAARETVEPIETSSGDASATTPQNAKRGHLPRPPVLSPGAQYVGDTGGDGTAATACAVGCSERGTCHEEFGRCDCPLGWGGSNCFQLLVPACQVAPNYVMPCSKQRMPYSCECKLQCEALAASSADSSFSGACLDVSNASEGAAALMLRPQELPQLDVALQKLYPLSADSRHRVKDVRPLAECPDHCSFHGWCVGVAGAGKPPRCSCFFGRRGLRCQDDSLVYCPSACSGRGRCNRGFCHCDPGAYGIDCSLMHALEAGRSVSRMWWEKSAGLEQDRTMRPRVYVYELPPRFTTWVMGWSAGENGDFDRPIGHGILERFLNSRHRTSNPEEADYFVVPVVGMRGIRRMAVMEYVRSQWPFWNRSTTPNHIWVGTDDLGASNYFHPSLPPPPEFSNKSIFLQHLGLNVGTKRENTVGCYLRNQDIVIPPLQIQAHTRPPSPHFSNGPPVKKDTFFFFAGTIHHDRPGLMRNVRLMVAQAHANRSGYLIQNGLVGDYTYEMARSVFCLAPPGKGGGWGMRFGEAVVAGCIPVLIQDNTTEVFEEILPYDRFTVRIPEADIPQMHTILAGISNATIGSMQRELACVYEHFLWSSVIGIYGKEDGTGDAFATMMAILHRRLDGKVGQWSTACRKEGLAQSMPVTCHANTRWQSGKNICMNDASLKAVAKKAGTSMKFWPIGGAACGRERLSPC